tara:strand:- start:118 stop:327 length:210 start_codon:yes stop_codon:yes gene_type:complete
MKEILKENIVLFMVVLTLAFTFIIAILSSNSQKPTSFEEGSTPYEQFPDSYENSSFNPANGYIGNTYEK